MAPRKEQELILTRNGAAAGPIWHLFGAAYGLEVRDPTADQRLVEFCLGTPPEQFCHGGGERMLLRRAMEGRLPPEVQWNHDRGKQAGDAVARLRAHPGEMDELLERLGATEQVREYVDLDSLRRVWQTGLQGPGGFRLAQGKLLRGIMCGCFIEDAVRLGSQHR